MKSIKAYFQKLQTLFVEEPLCDLMECPMTNDQPCGATIEFNTEKQSGATQ
jgi:hypothetical protein